MSNEPTQTTEPTIYKFRLCGDCSSGPPCRCSSDPAFIAEQWIGGKWVWIAVCTPGISTT